MKEDIIAMSLEAGFYKFDDNGDDLWICDLEELKRFFHMAQAAERNKLAQWMIDHSYTTGHGDTTEDLLKELEWQVREAEREACAKVCDEHLEWPSLGPKDCAAAIRARGQA
jgi:hypothetical protein